MDSHSRRRFVYGIPLNTEISYVVRVARPKDAFLDGFDFYFERLMRITTRHFQRISCLRKAMCFEWKRQRARFPNIIQRLGTPEYRQVPFSSFSRSRPQIGKILLPISSSQTMRTDSRGSPTLDIISIRLKDRLKLTYPVAHMITSAGNSDPFLNLIPVLVSRSIWLSFFNLILPSMISWLAPTSITV